MSTFRELCKTEKAMNLKVTSATGGENWFPHDNRESYFTLAVSLCVCVFVCLPSLFELQGGNAAEKRKKEKTQFPLVSFS